MSFWKKVKSPTTKIKRLPSVHSELNLNKVVRETLQNAGVFLSLESKVAMAKENNHDHQRQKNPTKWDSAKTISKLTIIVGCWMFCTIIFFMYKEKETIFRNCVLQPKETKDYTLNIPNSHLTLRVDLSGPFLSQLEENKLSPTEQKTRSTVKLWLERRGAKIDETLVVKREQSTDAVSFLLLDSEELAFSEAKLRHTLLELEHQSKLNASAVYLIKMTTNAPVAIPLAISYQVDPISTTIGVIYACLLLALLYWLIIFEIINRTLAAIVVSTLSLAVLSLVGERPSMEEVVSWLDVETLLLLLSMMLLVAIMAETGMFDFIAVFTFQVTKGEMWPLINLLCIITAVFSTCLDNVTTVLLITPITIKLCEVMNMHPIPVLTAMVLFSNIGGTATPVGDPPNVIIASNQIVMQSGVNFANFSLHMTIGVIAVCVQTYFQLRYMYRDANRLRLTEPEEDANDEVPPPMTSSQYDDFERTLSELKKKYKIHDKKLLIKSCVAIGFVVTVFFLHAFSEFSRVSLGWTALLGAILLLILADREDIESILHRVEWSTLLFFAALFVLMEALTKLGLIDYIGGHTEKLIMAVRKSQRLALALLLVLWISGVTSAFVDNIPLTTMMVRVVTSLGTNPSLGLPLPPLIWALSFGACLGGNGTLIGASANVVCAGVAEQHGYKFTFMEFFKIGFPIMIGHLTVASCYLLICHCFFTWH